MNSKASDVSELLPCPFCGGPARTLPALTTVYCDTPHCGANQRGDTQEYAIKMWNTRASPPLPSVEVERLREALRRLADKNVRQAECLEHYAEQSGHAEKPVPSVFHLQASHFRDIAQEALSALPLDGGLSSD